MAALSHIRRTQFLPWLAALAATVHVGCKEAEQIRSYSVPKETKAAVAEAAPAANPGEPTDRMLAAILPAGGQAWFFKVVGPIAAIDQREKEINDFFTAIRIADEGKPKWQLPAGWKEQAGNDVRLATIIVPSDGKPLEITVNALPWTGTPDDMLRNVNRWRGQLQLPPAGAQQIAELTRETKAGDLPMTIVDLRGRSSGAGMTPPFAGGPIGAAPGMSSSNASRAAQNAPPSGLPPGHPPIDSTASPLPTPTSEPSPHAAPPATPSADVPKFIAPTDWKTLEAGGIRKAAFAVGDKDHPAEVTLIDFRATEGPMIGDPLQNVNMWRQGVGLPPIKQDELSKSTESIEIDGKKALFARAVPDPSQSVQSKSNLATIAAMVTSGDQLWFIKLHGDRAVVAAQEDAFKTFLKSMRFAADGGANDGHK